MRGHYAQKMYLVQRPAFFIGWLRALLEKEREKKNIGQGCSLFCCGRVAQET